MGNHRLVGRHVKVFRGPYFHHGIYVRQGHVIQYSGVLSSGKSNGKVEEVTVSNFLKGAKLRIVRHYDDREYSRTETVSRARKRLNDQNYNLVFNNCEHFANWCITGKKKSKQTDVVKLPYWVWLKNR